MTEYYAVNPQDPNDRIPLDSATKEEAIRIYKENYRNDNQHLYGNYHIVEGHVYRTLLRPEETLESHYSDIEKRENDRKKDDFLEGFATLLIIIFTIILLSIIAH